jgi:hypothetical protein
MRTQSGFVAESSTTASQRFPSSACSWPLRSPIKRSTDDGSSASRRPRVKIDS